MSILQVEKQLRYEQALTTQIGRWLSHLQVQQKITLGFAISLGIAIAGASIGIILSDQQKQLEDRQSEDTLEEITLLTHLQVDMLSTLNEEHQVEEALYHSTDLKNFHGDIQEYHNNFIRLRQSWEQFKLTEGGTKNHDEIKQGSESKDVLENILENRLENEPENESKDRIIKAFLKKYEGVPDAYIQQLDRLLSNRDLTNLTDIELARLQADLVQLEQSPLVAQLENFTEELTVLRTTVTQQEVENTKLAINNSNILSLWVICISMGGAVIIAVLLSMIISRAIAYPIESLTKVTQQALNESDFDLQVPVLTQDEVGTLTLSFNQLIASVKNLLEQQQEYSHTLERKVSERTQELSEKNIQLQRLLEKLHSTQMQMVQSEKMSSLGQLVAGVAHEINNPINFINGNLIPLQKYIHSLLSFVSLYQNQYLALVSESGIEVEDMELEFLQEDLPKLLSSMQMGTERIRDIVMALRNFSRIDEAEFKAVNIHDGINSTLMILQHRLKAKPDSPEINVIRNYGDLPEVECYPGQLNQVFTNILANSIDALEEFNSQRGEQEIEEHPSHIEIRTSISDENWVQVAIADNGVGIPEAVRNQVFNPFFTTKPIGKGTGMGMAISYQIITEKHHGKLECLSTIGCGTEFIIQIPVKQATKKAD